MSDAAAGSTIGPIIFADRTARRQLRDYGTVVTFRKTSRTTGETWWRESRLGPKCGDVTVEEIGKVDPHIVSELEPYRELSGFSSVSAWQKAIIELNGGLPDTGYIYKVQSEGE
jgi:hypothetical protein